MALAACGSDTNDGGTTAGDGPGGAYTWWDPYPQHTDGSDWENRVQACGTDAGVTIESTAFDTTQLTNQALLSAQEGNAPDVILLDNPAVSTLAGTGMLTTMSEFGFDTAAIDDNLLDAGVIDGDAYGIPIGANTLALYYNEDVLDEAGVDATAITDWASLTEALAAIEATGNRGITFAGIGTEEGSFQFLPWFWGAGADLRELDSPHAAQALQLWVDWIEEGYAPHTVINNSQNTTWEEFIAGGFGFVENGTWQVNAAEEADFPVGVIPIPGPDGGVAPAPTGGEFITAPVQGDEDRYEVTSQIVECMTTSEGMTETATTFAYYIPPTTEGQEALLTDHPELDTWVEAVRSAKGRTSDDLGTDYPLISEALWTAVQNATSGAMSVEDALAQAQSEAEAATS